MNRPDEQQKPETAAPSQQPDHSAYRSFARKDWAALRAETPMTLSIPDVKKLTGILEPVSMCEVEEVYLPLTRLINLYAVAAETLHRETNLFLGKSEQKSPFIIGMAGSVAVGKSTMARILRALLAKWDVHANVALVPTDGFLWPNAELERRDLMARKGFPESYDARRLVRFLADIKSGKTNVKAPVYSHFTYDIVPGKTVTINRPDILIIEGLNVLQPARQPDKCRLPNREPNTELYDLDHLPYVSDFFDFSIYLDADQKQIERWYIERFMVLRQTAFQDPANYFYRYSKLDNKDAMQKASDLWQTINLVNLRENIECTRQRADLILHKARDHATEQILLRKQ
ncbi:MAG: type I pantothenate kinase [bacterium]|nr:type I pantothenate kinase [bacterium]